MGAPVRKEIRERSGTTYHLRYFDDWLDFVSCAERVERDRKGREFNGMTCASVELENPKWHGTETLAEAIALARKGWPEGRIKVRDMRRKLNIKNLMPQSQRIQATRDVSGDEPDIDLYLRGEPENMITLRETQIAQRGKVVRFILSRSASCGVDSSRIVLRGVALMIAFEALIQLGYSVDFTICFSETAGRYRGGGARIERYVPILHAGDPINMDTLAFMFIQPAVLRRLRLAADECESREIRNQFGFYDDGIYGVPCDPVFLPEYDLFLKWGEGLSYGLDQVVPFMFDVLRRVGIDIARSA